MAVEDRPPVLLACQEESERQLELMRRVANEMFHEQSTYLIGVNGSVARRECTSGSDVDLFFLTDGEVSPEKAAVAQEEYRRRLIDEDLVMPAQGGVFETPLNAEELISTIGGDDDTNLYITRRMLFLLEGEWTYNKPLFQRTRSRLIERYVTEDLASKKLCLFLLNDVIRYWRTICVDFEHKTAEANKPRAIRLIKLRFSRMLLYLGGVAAVGQAGGLDVKAKRERLEELFSMPTIERLEHVFGTAFAKPLQRYAFFLQQLDDSTIRDELNLVGDEGMQSASYKKMSDKAREFKDELLDLLTTHFGADHDVIKALLL